MAIKKIPVLKYLCFQYYPSLSSLNNCSALRKTRKSGGVCGRKKRKRKKLGLAMIHPARPIVRPVAITILAWTFCFARFWTVVKDGQKPRANIGITTGRDWGSASWIKGKKLGLAINPLSIRNRIGFANAKSFTVPKARIFFKTTYEILFSHRLTDLTQGFEKAFKVYLSVLMHRTTLYSGRKLI